MRSLLKAAALSGAATLLLSASQASAQTANGIVIHPRTYNDFPGSTETITNTPTNTLPASVTINDTNLVNSPPSGFANRDDIYISADGGATAYTGSIDQGFTISANVTLSDGVNSPRKEAGIRVSSGVSGDALFILDSDAGEIVAFGAGAPFYNFRPAIESTYTPGQTIFMQEQYVPGSPTTTGATPGTMQYWARLLPGGPLLTSGPLPYSNNEGGPTNYQIGFYDQVQPQSGNANDFINAQFNNISATVPEPGTLGLTGLAGMSLLAKRRSAKRV